MAPSASASRGADVVLEEEETAAGVSGQQHRPALQPAQPQQKPSLLLTFLSAGLANAISASSTNGFDIIKVRQQLDVERARRGFLAVASGMVRSEGALSLWNGVTASCLREATYSTIRMGGYESFKELYAPIVSPASFANKLLSGVTSGAVGAAISTPTDLVKVRFQAARPPDGRPPYRNTFVAFSEIFREGRLKAGPDQSGLAAGVRALYRGTTPNVIRAAILTSTQIGSYDQVKSMFKSGLNMQEGIGLHFASSMVAGFVCSAASQPVDVIKVRIMQGGAKQSAQASSGQPSASALQLLGSLLKNEGPLALYKGFAMCWARLGTHTVISLVLFERFRAVFGIKPL